MHNLGNPFVLWLLKSILLLILFYCGNKISHEKAYDKSYRLLAIFAYSLIEGLRWLRGPDYYHYYMYVHTNFNSIECTPEPELIYKLFVNVYFQTGLPHYFAFIIYSFILIYAFIKVIDHYKEYAKFALPLFYLLTCSSTENLIRQYIAISFFLLAIHFYLSNNKYSMIASLLAIPFIHLSGVFCWIIFSFFYYLKIKMSDKLGYVLIVSYILLYVFWSISDVSQYLQWLNLINFGDSKFAHYAEDTSVWFGEDAAEESLGNMSSMVKYVGFISSSIIIYYGYKECQMNEKLYIPYWLTICSLFVDIIGNGLELMSRMSLWINTLTSVILSSGIYYLKEKKIEKRIIYMMLIIIYVGYHFIRPWGNQGKWGSAFVWDL